jgi:RNA polymerase sigma factor (sigma-70 family)
MPVDKPTDLRERLKNGDNEAFVYLYQSCYGRVEAFIKANSGNEQDARDVFQEALFVLFKKAGDANFQWTADPGAYLSAVVRNLWLYRLRGKQAHPTLFIPENDGALMGAADDFEEILLREHRDDSRYKTISACIQQLRPECQDMIKYTYYQQLATAEIARRLQYTEAFVKVKKHRCMEALRGMVRKVSTWIENP